MKDFKISTNLVSCPSRGKNHYIRARIRFDDECGNGHQSFAVTADIHELRNGRYIEDGGGCCHDEIAKAFPWIAPYIKWHLTSTDGPMHYVANTIYWAEKAALGKCKYDGGLSEDKRLEAAKFAASTSLWPELENTLNEFYAEHGEPEQTAKAFLATLKTDLNGRLAGLLVDFDNAMLELSERAEQ